MNKSSRHEKDIFNDALELTSAEARQAYVREACAGDEELRQRVEALLEAAGTATGFLPHRPDVQATKVLTEPVTEGPGTAIGRYKLLEPIGEGGFGVVYMAEQREPVRRRVALKIIKAGMDTKQVIARFEAERQALALMEHPNIAQVFDAGATETGRPYFVMELVRGKPITQFCDEACLSTGERLQLFVQVCHAVQHAHQKGIIHRELLVKKLKRRAPDPRFIVERERLLKTHRKGLTTLAADQCPYVAKSVERIAEASRTLGLEPKVVRVGTAKASRELPTPYGVFSIIYDGKLIAHRPISATRFMSIMRRNAERRLRRGVQTRRPPAAVAAVRGTRPRR